MTNGKARYRRTTREKGAPSCVFDQLHDLGVAARMGYLLASSTAPTPAIAALYARMRDHRAEAYDAALTESLARLDVIRDALGDRAADVVEARYIDGATWRAAGEAAGLDEGAALRLARSALDWLDANA